MSPSALLEDRAPSCMLYSMVECRARGSRTHPWPCRAMPGNSVHRVGYDANPNLHSQALIQLTFQGLLCFGPVYSKLWSSTCRAEWPIMYRTSCLRTAVRQS